MDVVSARDTDGDMDDSEVDEDEVLELVTVVSAELLTVLVVDVLVLGVLVDERDTLVLVELTGPFDDDIELTEVVVDKELGELLVCVELIVVDDDEPTTDVLLEDAKEGDVDVPPWESVEESDDVVSTDEVMILVFVAVCDVDDADGADEVEDVENIDRELVLENPAVDVVEILVDPVDTDDADDVMDAVDELDVALASAATDDVDEVNEEDPKDELVESEFMRLVLSVDEVVVELMTVDRLCVVLSNDVLLVWVVDWGELLCPVLEIDDRPSVVVRLEESLEPELVLSEVEDVLSVVEDSAGTPTDVLREVLLDPDVESKLVTVLVILLGAADEVVVLLVDDGDDVLDADACVVEKLVETEELPDVLVVVEVPSVDDALEACDVDTLVEDDVSELVGVCTDEVLLVTAAVDVVSMLLVCVAETL